MSRYFLYATRATETHIFFLKGILYVDKVLTLFSDMISTQHAFFKEELEKIEKISSAFISQVENSNRWHDSHDKKPGGVHTDVKEIKARK